MTIQIPKDQKICPICQTLIKWEKRSRHHLEPREVSKNNQTINLHQFCHKVLHIMFTNNFLKYKLNTEELIANNPVIQAIRPWLQKLDGGYLNKHRRCGLGSFPPYVREEHKKYQEEHEQQQQQQL